ncbi:MAG: CapA family protein [Pseudomonadota bacterium]
MWTNARASTVVAIALVVAGCAGQPVQPTAPAPQPEATAEPSTPEPEKVLPIEPERPDPETLRLTIAAAGDMMLGTDYPDNRLPDDDAVGFLASVTPYFESADIAFGNLEGVLVDGGEPGKRCSNPRACYLFRSPTRYAAHLAAAGFDVMSLANNHARDFGEAGRDATMQALQSVGIHHSGREGDIASWDVNGVSVALIAFAVTRNSFSMLDITSAAFEVADLSRDHDIVLVSFHGGAEGLDALHIPFAEETYYNEPRGDVVAFSRAMVDAGADVILGHGPHVVRAIERYRDRLIAYSLGNFATYYGISVAGLKGVAPILQLTVDGNGKFLSGKLIATHQLRPAGPTLDPDRRAVVEIQRLSRMDFGTSGVRIDDDGALTPIQRAEVRSAQKETAD